MPDVESAAQYNYVRVARVEDLPSGERLFIEIDDLPVVVINLGGIFFAIGDICTHDEGPLGDGEIEDHHIICPRHGAKFDLRTGKALTLPAVIDTPAFPVRVAEGWIELGLKTPDSQKPR